MFLYCASSFKAEEKTHPRYGKEIFIIFKIYLQITFKKRGQIQNTKIIH